MQRLPHGEVLDVHVEALRQVAWQTLHLDLVHQQFLQAAFACPDRVAYEMQHHACAQYAPPFDLVEVDMLQPLDNVVDLEVLDEHVVGGLTGRKLNDGALGYLLELARELARVDAQQHWVAAPVQHGGDAALAAHTPRRSLLGLRSQLGGQASIGHVRLLSSVL